MGRRRWMSVVMCAALAGVAAQVQAAGVLDSLFGGKKDLGPASQREWRLDEFTQVRLAPKEAGAAANQHPASIDAAALTTRLEAVEAVTLHGTDALFDPDEVKDLVPVLVRALSLARPDDDVLLLSTARRGGKLVVPMALTARLFVEGDALQLIVHDTRVDFIEKYRNARIVPKFEFGSRAQKARAEIRSAGAASKRADWLSIPLGGLSAAAVPAAPVKPVAATAPAAATPAPAPAAAAQPAAPGSPAAIGDEVEQRLIVLKRLRDKGLISEEEYQQKRKEVLQGL